MSFQSAAEPQVFAAALQWLQGTLLGTVATTVAVIAVASVGLLLLSGRVDLRRGTQVIFGCFILFGASTIASGITKAVTSRAEISSEAVLPPPPSYQSPTSATSPSASAFDPYAGAALPAQR